MIFTYNLMSTSIHAFSVEVDCSMMTGDNIQFGYIYVVPFW